MVGLPAGLRCARGPHRRIPPNVRLSLVVGFSTTRKATAGRRLTGRPLERRVILAMIKRRSAAAALRPSSHTFRATGITAYLSNGGTLEQAQQIAGHASPKTTKPYDRTADPGNVNRCTTDWRGGFWAVCPFAPRTAL